MRRQVHGPNEKTTKFQKKELNKRETNNLLEVEFKTLVIRMLSELRENINSIKVDQSEMKDVPTEMKNNCRKSTVE